MREDDEFSFRHNESEVPGNLPISNRQLGTGVWNPVATILFHHLLPPTVYATTLIRTIIISYLDYCHSLLAGLLADAFALLFLKSQSIARVIVIKVTSEHGMPLLTISPFSLALTVHATLYTDLTPYVTRPCYSLSSHCSLPQ